MRMVDHQFGLAPAVPVLNVAHPEAVRLDEGDELGQRVGVHVHLEIDSLVELRIPDVAVVGLSLTTRALSVFGRRRAKLDGRW